MARFQAAVLHGIDDLRLQEWELPSAPPEGHVRVRMRAVGICGSDIHYWKRGRIGGFVLDAPMVIGHECAGEVAAVGAGVAALRPGDRVALEPGYVDHPAEWCYRLPERLSFEEGAMVEPLSVGVHACRRAGIQPGKRVAIMGAGPIGLVTLLAARAFGADAIAITDLKQANLDLARQLGADATLLASVLQQPADAAEALRAAAGAPEGFDVVIDCAGFQETLQTAVKACADGGRVAVVGMGQEEARLPVTEAVVREIDLVGVFRYANTYPLCLSLLASGRVDVQPLITHRFGFSAADIQHGFEAAHTDPAAVKVMFHL